MNIWGILPAPQPRLDVSFPSPRLRRALGDALRASGWVDVHDAPGAAPPEPAPPWVPMDPDELDRLITEHQLAALGLEWPAPRDPPTPRTS